MDEVRSSVQRAQTSRRRFQVGDRVDVASIQTRGIIRFFGSTCFAAGDWVGVELDAAVGKNDGSVNDVRYFECEPFHGLFVRPTAVAFVQEGSLATDSLHSPRNGSDIIMKRSTAATDTDRLRGSMNGAASTPRSGRPEVPQVCIKAAGPRAEPPPIVEALLARDTSAPNCCRTSGSPSGISLAAMSSDGESGEDGGACLPTKSSLHELDRIDWNQVAAVKAHEKQGRVKQDRAIIQTDTGAVSDANAVNADLAAAFDRQLSGAEAVGAERQRVEDLSWDEQAQMVQPVEESRKSLPSCTFHFHPAVANGILENPNSKSGAPSSEGMFLPHIEERKDQWTGCCLHSHKGVTMTELIAAEHVQCFESMAGMQEELKAMRESICFLTEQVDAANMKAAEAEQDARKACTMLRALGFECDHKDPLSVGFHESKEAAVGPWKIWSDKIREETETYMSHLVDFRHNYFHAPVEELKEICKGIMCAGSLLRGMTQKISDACQPDTLVEEIGRFCEDLHQQVGYVGSHLLQLPHEDAGSRNDAIRKDAAVVRDSFECNSLACRQTCTSNPEFGDLMPTQDSTCRHFDEDAFPIVNLEDISSHRSSRFYMLRVYKRALGCVDGRESAAAKRYSARLLNTALNRVAGRLSSAPPAEETQQANCPETDELMCARPDLAKVFKQHGVLEGGVLYRASFHRAMQHSTRLSYWQINALYDSLGEQTEARDGVGFLDFADCVKAAEKGLQFLAEYADMCPQSFEALGTPEARKSVVFDRGVIGYVRAVVVRAALALEYDESKPTVQQVQEGLRGMQKELEREHAAASTIQNLYRQSVATRKQLEDSGYPSILEEASQLPEVARATAYGHTLEDHGHFSITRDAHAAAMEETQLIPEDRAHVASSPPSIKRRSSLKGSSPSPTKRHSRVTFSAYVEDDRMVKAVKVLQVHARAALARRRLANASGRDFFSVAQVVRSKHASWSRVFDTVLSTGDAGNPSIGLNEFGFSRALRLVHPDLATPQLNALYRGVVEGTRQEFVNLRIFCAVAQAVAAGPALAAEYADLTESAFVTLGTVGGDEAASKIQTFWRGSLA